MSGIDKLKKDDKEYLNNLKNKEFDKEKFIFEEILYKICEISQINNIEICLNINRKGKIIDVAIGNKDSCSINLRKSENNYLTGERIIHTHPMGSSVLSEMDLSLLKNNNCDCVCAISIKNGIPFDSHIAFCNNDNIEDFYVDDARYINKYGLLEKILYYDKQRKKDYKNKSLTNFNDRAILVCVDFNNNKEITNSFYELKSLAETAKIEVLDSIFQKRHKPDSKFFVGEGKLKEIKNLIQIKNVNLVIFENELSGSKLVNIEEFLGVKVIDRSMLILDIFAGRAKTKEGKLQVELAQLKYNLPRLNSLSYSDGKFGGGVGMRGPGESKLELNRRIVENNILKYTNELKKLKKQRDLNRASRIKNKKPVVSIVGYTNSGKSSLLNLLAKSDIYVKDELFATLDTTTRTVWLPNNKEIILTDTVGFIENLPHEFIEAFGSTLEECVFSDLLLHVVDLSNNNFLNHINVTNKVLKNLGCEVPVLMVYNKIDNVSSIDEFDNLKGVFISVKQQKNIDILKNQIIKALNL